MNKERSWNNELNEYIKQGEQSQIEKAKAWKIAIGLQDVDNLKTSKYLIETAKEHIEGNIDIYEAKYRIDQYYKQLNNRKASKEKENGV